MPQTRRRNRTNTETLRGRQFRPARVDFLTKPYVQRAEDRVRGGSGGTAQGEGFAFATDAGELPAHSIIDAQRDRALAQVEEAFEVPRSNASRARDEAVEALAQAERERDRLAERRAAKRAELDQLEATHAA